MVYFDRNLAQSIIDRSMRIVDCNINMMDAQGIIVASGDPARIGTLHRGALLALAKEDMVEIDASLADKLSGAKPGVNLPLRMEGRIVGCIGLTGEPSSILCHAELVRLAAETMLDQARLMQLLARDARLQEELVLSLVRGEDLVEARLDWARRLGIDLDVPRVAVVIEVDSGDLNRDAALSELQRLHASLITPACENLVATVSLSEIVVLKPALTAKKQWDPVALRARVEQMEKRIRQCGPLGIRMALGHYFPGRDGLARSYQSARTTLDIGKIKDRDQVCYFYEDLRLLVLLDPLRQSWSINEIQRILMPLLEKDRQGQLTQTLKVWFEQRMLTNKTAEVLGIHRNTLDYRMRRVREICDIDLSRIEDCIRLYLALQIVPLGEREH